MSVELAEKSWNATKPKDEPEFAASQPDHRQNLIDRAEGVVRTGVTVNKFEEKVKELHTKEKATVASDAGPLGTTNAIGEEAPKAKAAPELKANEAKTVAAAKAKKASDKALADKKAADDKVADAKAAADAKAERDAAAKAEAKPEPEGRVGGLSSGRASK